MTVRFGSEWKVVMSRTRAVADESLPCKIVEHDSDEWPGTELLFQLEPAESGWTIADGQRQPNSSDSVA